uniref:Uncharacterized protein n=1 Tax=Aegilops tauschii subsp. strangulata TaxID=200361 RepID=A0A453D2X8_AEGTS
EWEQGSGSSTVAEWGLVCGERYKVGLVQALFFAGCMIGEYVTALLCSHRSSFERFRRLDGSSCYLAVLMAIRDDSLAAYVHHKRCTPLVVVDLLAMHL